jgi:hypothetical protein
MKCTRVNKYLELCTLRNFSWFLYPLSMGYEYIHFHHSVLPIFAVLLVMASKLYMSCTNLAGWQLHWSRHISSTKCSSWFHWKLFMTGYWGCGCVAVGGHVWRRRPRICAAAELRSRSVGIPWTEFSHQHVTYLLFPHKYDENKYSLKNISKICDIPKIFWASSCPWDDFHYPVYSHHNKQFQIQVQSATTITSSAQLPRIGSCGWRFYFIMYFLHICCFSVSQIW